MPSLMNVPPDETDYANGFEPKTVMTRVGELTFDVPQVRGGGSVPAPWKKARAPSRRSILRSPKCMCRAFATRKVTDILVKLLGPEVSLSSTQVSRAAEQLDAARACGSRERPLDETPYVFLDARYERVREGGQLVDCAVLVAVGVTSGGHRRILGVSVALSEAEVHWRTFQDSLIRRGLKGVKLIISDDHAGLKAARRAALPVFRSDAPFHLQQNAHAYIPRLRSTQAGRPAHSRDLQCAGSG